MRTRPDDLQTLMHLANKALGKGDARRAKKLFERIVAGGGSNASVWLGIARACNKLKDVKAEVTALDKTLALEPGNPWALIMKADYYNAIGDARAACAYYVKTVNVAPPADQRPVELDNEINRAEAMSRRFAQQYETYLRQRLAEKGNQGGAESARFARSLDMIFGKEQIYYDESLAYCQQPRTYYFPGLPQTQFFERSDFPSLDAVEAATGDIRAELVEVMESDDAFSPYVTGESNRPQADHALKDNENWGAFYLWKDGEIVPENAARCPKTVEVMKGFPLAGIKGRSPNVLFSLLRPGMRIPPHNGLLNTRLICHLPLVVPEGCGLRVGDDSRTLEEGRAWLFDDSIEHEAWNNSGENRAILLFEIWRPELTGHERSLVEAMFEAIDAYGT